MLLVLLLACAGRPDTVRDATDGRGPARVDPALPAFEAGSHAHVLGWSTDGREVGWCAEAPSPRCVFRTLDGAERRLHVGASPGKEPDPALSADLITRVAALGYGTRPGAWDYADTLALTWSVTPGEPGVRDAVLQVGAKRVDGPPVFPVTLSEPGFDAIHLEYLALSPDGAHVGVVAHATHPERGDTFRIAIVPARQLLYGAFSAGAP